MEVEIYEYDIHERLSKITQSNASTIQYDYNKLDALISIDYSDENDGEVLYAYDTEGRQVSMSDLASDGIGQLESVTIKDVAENELEKYRQQWNNTVYL